MGGVNGLLLVDKPRGPTSHDLVSGARRLYGTRAVGHAGTLDPMASGLLLLLFGEATKLSAYLTAADKRYVATIRFGRSTDSLDAEGAVVEERDLPDGWLGDEALEQAVRAERARTEQVPPGFSAIHVGGARAYEASRRGIAVVLPARPVQVHELQVCSRSSAELELSLSVSKGYYVRSLARDLSDRLGVPGHLSALRRVSSGPFHIEEAAAWPLAQPAALMPVAAAARRALEPADLTEDGAARARVGKTLTLGDFVTDPGPGLTAWFSPEGHLVALGQRTEEGHFAVRRGFAAPSP
jgi:tRNA pseudouridine55 synthase